MNELTNEILENYREKTKECVDKNFKSKEEEIKFLTDLCTFYERSGYDHLMRSTGTTSIGCILEMDRRGECPWWVETCQGYSVCQEPATIHGELPT